MAELRSPAELLIVGGGVAALEALMALRDLAGERVRVTLVAPEPDFGFIPVDRHGRVEGLEDVYAAGDATNFSVKQGGLATQQADAVAEHIAAGHGAPLDPSPFRPVLRGLLFTGAPDRYLRDDAVAAQPLWWPPTKIAGRYLAPYVYEREPAAAPGPAPAGFADLEVPLESATPVVR